MRLGLSCELGLNRANFPGGRGLCAETLVILKGYLQKRRLELRVFLIGNLVVAHLEAGELVDHFGERKRNFTLIRRRNFTAEKFRRLLIDGTEEDGGATRRHAALHFGSFQENTTVQIHRSLFQQIARKTGDQVGEG